MQSYTNLPNKETEFNSSIATLQRIDFLMRQLHDLSRGIIPTNKFGIPLTTDNPYELYINTTERLRLEGRNKFTEKEQNELDKIRLELEFIKVKYGNNLYMRTISRGMPPHQYENMDYYRGWNELQLKNKEYEIMIVALLDDHGMLLKDKDIRLAAARA